MKKQIILLLLISLLLVGCELTLPDTTKETVPYYAGHTDHVSPVARNRSGFFVDTVQNEKTVHYLSYKEPDGCITHIVSFDPWDEALKLFCVDKTFYYINADATGSEGILRSVTFSGEQNSMQADDHVLNYIIRTDDTFLYCAADNAANYIRITCDLTSWSAVSREEAIG